MYFSLFITSLLAITTSLHTASAAMGIHCHGSFFCSLARSTPSIMQMLRDAVYASNLPLSTIYSSGNHIACLKIGPNKESNKVGVCLFPQGSDLTLAQIRPLVDALIKHNCNKCGSVPIHFVDQNNNDPTPGILTSNYMNDISCSDKCIFTDDIASFSIFRRGIGPEERQTIQP